MDLLQNTVLEMYRLAESFSQDLDSRSFSNLGQLFDFVRTIPYRKDSTQGFGNVEVVQRPALTILNGGDCDDKAVLAAAGLKLLGYRYRFVTVAARSGGPASHVYAQVFDGGRWKGFDATYITGRIFTDPPGYERRFWMKG